MKQFQTITNDTFDKDPFQLIGKDWMLVTAKKGNQVNTMTASWGGVGIMWGKKVAFVVIRPQRYTKEFIDANTTFSLTFFSEEYKKQLGYLGKVSGRDEDKITKSGLTLVNKEETPYFEEGKLVLLCKKLFAQPLEEASFLAPELVEQWYSNKDYHTLYIAEIEDVLEAK